MTDPTQQPVVVPPTPTEAQLAAGIRQVGAALGVIAAAFGFTATASKIGVVVSVAPQIAIVLSVVGPLIFAALTAWGQRATRHQAQKLTQIAGDPRTPDEVAQVRGS